MILVPCSSKVLPFSRQALVESTCGTSPVISITNSRMVGGAEWVCQIEPAFEGFKDVFFSVFNLSVWMSGDWFFSLA
jgi:hypothetical protein